MTQINVSGGAFGGLPYGDAAEDSGPPVPIIITDIYRKFLFTDARSVMIVLRPHHINYIKNPAFRTGTTGWSVTGNWVVNPDEAWVGQSLQLTGAGSLRYKDGAYFNYVGPREDLMDQEIYDPGGAQAGWTFSVYVKGQGRVRLTMDAYEPTDLMTEKSPPKYSGITASSAPESAAFDANKPFLVQNGVVWKLKDPPYYLKLGILPQHSDPTQIDGRYVLPPALEGPDGRVWEATSGTKPFYTSWGTPATVASPETSNPAGKYLRRQSDSSLWILKSPLPGAPPDGDEPGNPPGWYYVQTTLPQSPDPAATEPDLSRLPYAVVRTGDGTVFLRNPTGQTKPFYSLISVPATRPNGTDIASQYPTDRFIKDPGGNIWERAPGPPWYEQTEETYPAKKVAGEWVSVSDSEKWQRVILSTSSRREGYGAGVSFFGCTWIDGLIEGEGNIQVSAAMLDPSEYPVAQYFDGGIVEDEFNDDFIWGEVDKDGVPKADNSISLYYYDRLIRTRWLWQNLPYVVPVGRPYQIFFNGFDRPYVTKDQRVSATRMAEQNQFRI